MNTSPYAAYTQVATRTITRKDEILLRLYEGAIQAVRLARQNLAARQVAAKGAQISKAIAIIGELDCALDHDIGGDMTANLSRLYQYMLARLTHVNLRNEPAGLDEVEALLCELQEAFATAIEQSDTVPPVPESDTESVSARRVNIVT